MKARHIEVLRTYIRGCNTGDAYLLRASLSEDVKIYFIDLPAVEGRDAAIKFWQNFRLQFKTVWSIDDLIVDSDKAAMEWTAVSDRGTEKAQLNRGIDWFLFKEGLISEIRQYYDARGTLPANEVYEQKEFPYSQRGYPSIENIDSFLP